MDFFGIGIAMRGLVRTYAAMARGTGRTTALVESVRDGDRIVFASAREAERVRRLCLARGVNVECRVCDPSDPHSLRERGRAEGRTIFDHAWVEMCYAHAVDSLSLALDDLARETSRRDAPPLPENSWGAKERARWVGGTCVRVPTDTMEQEIQAHVRRAVATERERCAKLCEAAEAVFEHGNGQGDYCARAIREQAK